MTTFNDSYEKYKMAWRNFSLEGMKPFISKDYHAREIRGEEIVDFGYKESLEGWKQAFDYFSDKQAKWLLTDINSIALKEDEVMVISSASLEVDGTPLETANLFFETFKKSGQEWEMVRSYIETRIRLDRLEDLQVGGGI